MVTKTVQGHNALSRLWSEAVQDEYRYVPELQQWRIWRKDGWENGDADAFLSMSQVAECAWRDKKGRPDPVTAGSVPTANGGLHFAGKRHAKPLDEWDANPWVLGVGQGRVLDLKGDPGVPWRPVAMLDYVTKTSHVDFEDYRDSPVERFLTEKLPDDEVREWMGRWCGYCLSGSTKEQLAVWVRGDTATGKSTLRAMLGDLLGDYHYGLANDIFKADAIARGAEKGYALERCPGVRLVSFTEWGQKWQLDESFFTAITGGDTVYGRRVRGVPMNFVPSFKLMAFANYWPGQPISPQVMRRLVPIPMDVSHEHDPDVDAMGDLTCPRSLGAFASWCFQGYRRYLADGLRPLPAASQAIVRELLKGSEGIEDDAGMRALFEQHFAFADKVDRAHARVPCSEVHAKMLNGGHASSLAGRQVVRWCRAHFTQVKVRGQRGYEGVWRHSDLRPQ